MKTLLLLRHAKSSWKHDDLDDHDRPLNKRGKRDAPKMGDLIAAEKLLPDLIVSSTARRARMTTEQVIDHSGYRGETHLVRDLYHADRAGLVQLVACLPDHSARVLLVGVRMPPNYGEAFTKAFENAFVEVAKDHHAALLPDLFEGFAEKQELFQADRIHPAESAQPAMLKNIWAKLAPLLREK